MATNDDPGSRIMPASELKPLLVLSKRQPVSCAVGMTRDKQAIVLLHRRTKPRKLLAELRKQASSAGVALDAASLRFGRASVDGGSDSTMVTFTVNKPAPGPLRMKLLERLRPAGFQRCEIVVDEALEDETDDDAPGEAAASPVADPSANDPAPGSGALTAASQAAPAAPADPATLKADLTALVRQIAPVVAAAPGQKAALVSIATDARDRLKAGDLAGAGAGTQALRDALGAATAPPTMGRVTGLPGLDGLDESGNTLATPAGTPSNTASPPAPINLASLPSGSLGKADYAAVDARNRYLAGKYDPDSLSDRALDVATGAMRNPADVLTATERAEHQALGARIRETLDPPPTPDGARLQAMMGSPIGTIASVAMRAAGGNQATQDAALTAGTAAEGLGLAFAGARAGAATRFLGAQTGEAVPLEPPREIVPRKPSWGNGDPVEVERGQQDKHIEGTKNYIPGRSVLSGDAQKLLETYSGKGDPVGKPQRGQPGFRERFDTGDQVIGTYYDAQIDAQLPTTHGIIHYSGRGAHIVPSEP